MYDIIKNVIDAKRYELADMLKKIDVLWIQGSITDEEHDELIKIAQDNAKTENSVDILTKLMELDIRVTALENAANTDTPSGDVINGVEYSDYVVGKWYYNGDVVKFEENIYICVAPVGMSCVWSPTEFPSYWSIVEPDSDI